MTSEAMTNASKSNAENSPPFRCIGLWETGHCVIGQQPMTEMSNSAG